MSSSSENEEDCMKNGDLFAKQKAQKAEKAQKVEKKSKRAKVKRKKPTINPRRPKTGKMTKHVCSLNCLKSIHACGIFTIRIIKNVI